MARIFGSPLLALFLLAAAGCDSLIRDMMFDSPNGRWTFDGETGVLSRYDKLEDIDHELWIDVGPPDAVIHTWISEPQPGSTPAAAARGTVLLLHGYRTRSVWFRDIADRLTRAGFRAILVDLRGHGYSTGQHTFYGAVESRDLVQVIDELQRHDKLEGLVGVWGISMGGSTAIQLAGRDPRIRAVVAVAPYTSLREIFEREMRLASLGLRQPESIQQLIDEAADEVGVDPDEADALAAIRRTDASVLIVHGEWDAIVPFDHGRRLHEAAADHSELVKLGMTGHLGAFFSPEAKIRSIDFFTRHADR
jgi:pimeloyl-ACP methyl ester carboxylesterase